MSNAPMKHEEFEHLLADFAAGNLDRANSEFLTAHLQHCTLCNQQLEGFRRVMSELGSARDTRRVPDGYFATILPRFLVRLSKRGNGSTGFGWFQLAPPFAAAVVAVGLLTTFQLPADSGASNGLRSLSAEFGTAEMTDALLSEIEQQSFASINADDVFAVAMTREAFSRELLERIAESTWGAVSALQTVDDLENDELDILLQRLESRKYL